MKRFKFLIVAALCSTFSLSSAIAKEDCPIVITPLSSAQLKEIGDVMARVAPKDITTVVDDTDYSTQPLDQSKFENDDHNEVAMQIGLGGNPDIDNGKPFRDKAWVMSILYPVKATHVGAVPTTIYIEVRCQGLGQQPASAYTDNLNVRCGPGAVADAKLADWLSAYTRVGVVTSRFSHNGAPKGQINPKTGIEFRLYPNDTWFTGVGMGAGIKIKVNSTTQIFGEYTKFYIQQTDNPAYQFRGGYNAGISKKFWLFQGE